MDDGFLDPSYLRWKAAKNRWALAWIDAAVLGVASLVCFAKNDFALGPALHSLFVMVGFFGVLALVFRLGHEIRGALREVDALDLEDTCQGGPGPG